MSFLCVKTRKRKKQKLCVCFLNYLSHIVQTIKPACEDVIFLWVSQMNLAQIGVLLSYRSFPKKTGSLGEKIERKKWKKSEHKKQENCTRICWHGASEINFQTWHWEHARTHKYQLIYNATAGFSLIQSKVQSVGADEFSQFIPDTMPQFSLWAVSKREWKHQYVWKRNL